jgi:hypothetical protein
MNMNKLQKKFTLLCERRLARSTSATKENNNDPCFQSDLMTS